MGSGSSLADGFRFPTAEDREAAGEGSPRVRPPGKVRLAIQALLGALGSIALVGYFLVSFGANVTSCFSSGRQDLARSPVPRAPRLDVDSEFRVARRLADRWISSGRSVDELSLWMLDDDAVNAASLGDGVFVLWRGLNALSEADLDAIFAHEIGHDELGHSKRLADLADVTNSIGEALGTVSHSGDQATATLKKWSGAFVLPKYSRQQELDADGRAVLLLEASGYEEPAAVECRAFVNLRNQVGEAGGGFFADHPSLTERIAALRQTHPTPSTERECR